MDHAPMNSQGKTLFALILAAILCDAGFINAQERGGMRAIPAEAGQVTGIGADSVIVQLQSGESRTIELTSALKVARTTPIERGDLQVNQNVLAHGHRDGDNEFRANMLIVTAVALPPLPQPPDAAQDPARAGNQPLIGAITALEPLTVNTPQGTTVAVTLTGNTRIVREARITASDIKVGDKVRLMPGRLVVTSSTSAPAAAGDAGTPGAQEAPPGPPAAGDKWREPPSAPAVKKSVFNRAVMDQQIASPFGFKDPNMLRINVFSFYDEYAESLLELGVHWMEPAASFCFNWNLVQHRTEAGGYTDFDWQRYDRLVKHAQANNINISAILTCVEPHAGPRRHRPPQAPKDMNGYLAFVKAAIERYNGDGKNDMPGLLCPIRQWKVEDEVMAPQYWRGSGSDYATLLSQVYAVIKKTDPSVTVICSMVRGYPGLGKDPRACMNEFYDRLARLKAPRPYDVMDQHWMITDPSAPRESQYLQIKDLIDDVNATAKSRGFAQSPFYVLETAGLVSDEKAQVDDMVRRYVYAMACGVKRIMWSGLKAIPDEGMNQTQARDPLRRNTLIAGDGTRKLAYHAYKKMVEVLNGADLASVALVQANRGGLYVVQFLAQGKPLWVLWNDSGKETVARLTVPDTITSVRATSALPNGAKGADIKDAAVFYQAVLPVKDRISDIPLRDGSPMYVEAAVVSLETKTNTSAGNK